MKEREEKQTPAEKAQTAWKDLEKALKNLLPALQQKSIDIGIDLKDLPPDAAEPIIEAYQKVAEASKEYVGELKLRLNVLEKDKAEEKARVLAEIAKYSAQGAKANRQLAECLANSLTNGQYDLLVEVDVPVLTEAPEEVVKTESVAKKIKEHVEAAKQCQKDASDAVKRLESLEFFNTGMPVLKMSAEEMSKEQLDNRTNEIRDAKVAAQQNLKEAKKESTEVKKQLGVFKANVKKAINTQKQGLDGVLNLMEKKLKHNLAQQLESKSPMVEASSEREPANYIDMLSDLEAVYGGADVPASSLNYPADILPKTKEERLGLKNQSNEEGVTTGVQNRTAARDALENVLNEYKDKILEHITFEDYSKAIAKLKKNLDSSPMVAFYRFAEAVSIRGTAQTFWRKKAEAARMRGMVKEIRKNVKEVVPGEGTGDTGTGSHTQSLSRTASISSREGAMGSRSSSRGSFGVKGGRSPSI